MLLGKLFILLFDFLHLVRDFVDFAVFVVNTALAFHLIPYNIILLLLQLCQLLLEKSVLINQGIHLLLSFQPFLGSAAVNIGDLLFKSKLFFALLCNLSI